MTRSVPLFACVVSRICLTCRSSQRSATPGVTAKNIWTFSRPQRGSAGKNKQRKKKKKQKTTYFIFLQKAVLLPPQPMQFCKKNSLGTAIQICLGDKRSFSAMFPSNYGNWVPARRRDEERREDRHSLIWPFHMNPKAEMKPKKIFYDVLLIGMRRW